MPGLLLLAVLADALAKRGVSRYLTAAAIQLVVTICIYVSLYVDFASVKGLFWTMMCLGILQLSAPVAPFLSQLLSCTPAQLHGSLLSVSFGGMLLLSAIGTSVFGDRSAPPRRLAPDTPTPRHPDTPAP